MTSDAQRRSQQLRRFFLELSQNDCLWIKDAAHIFHIRERQLRRLCVEKGIGVRLAGSWVIFTDRLQVVLNSPPAGVGTTDDPPAPYRSNDDQILPTHRKRRPQQRAPRM